MSFERPVPEDIIAASEQEAAARSTGGDSITDMDINKNKQPNNAPSNEADFGDLLEAELADVSKDRVSEKEIQEKARQQEQAEARERLESVGKMHQAQEAVIRAVLESGRTPEVRRGGELWDSRLDGMKPIDQPEETERGEEKREKHANKAYAAGLASASGKTKGVFKPVLGEAHYYDEQVRPERRHRKEWLSFQMDTIFDVNRSPAAAVREFPIKDQVTGEETVSPGSLSEFLDGQVTDVQSDWRERADQDDIGRIADFHYLIGETDGNDGQFVMQADNRVKNFDRGEAFLDMPGIKLKSAAMEESERRGLAANREVLAAAENFQKSEKLQAAAEQAFDAAFGPDSGTKRFKLMKERLEKYVTNRGVPYQELRNQDKWQIIDREKKG